MAFNPKLSDIVLDAGGDTLLRYGTLTRRLTPPARGGEALIETLTRAAAGSTVTFQGTFLSVPANIPRVIWIRDASGVTQARLLLETVATTKLVAPEDLSNGAWVKTLATVPSVNNASPRGGDLTASFLREDTSVSSNHWAAQNFTITAGHSVGGTRFFKANGRTKIEWVFANANVVGMTNFFGVIVDTVAGTATTATIGTGVALGAFIVALANGWWGVSIYGTVDGSTTSVWDIMALMSGASTAYTGDGASGMLIWGCAATDNQPAGLYWGTGASRSAADSLTIPYPCRPQAGWLYVKFIESGGAFGTNFGGLVALAADLNPGIGILKQNGVNRYYAYHHNGSTEVDSLLGTGPLIGDTVELLLILSATGTVELRQSLNGAAETTGGVSSPNALATTWGNQVLGLNAGVNKAAATVARVTVGLGSLPTSVTDVRSFLAGLVAA